MKKTKVKIEAGKSYTAYEIVKNNLIPGVNTLGKLKNLMLDDLGSRGPLEPVKVARGEGVKWLILGKNIIKYLKINDETKKGQHNS